MAILTHEFSAKGYGGNGPTASISAGDDENLHTFVVPLGGYFTGIVANLDAANVIDVVIVDIHGKEVSLPLAAGAAGVSKVMRFKNQHIQAIKIALDPVNPAATTVNYVIMGKTHVPTTEYETMILESDSEFSLGV